MLQLRNGILFANQNSPVHNQLKHIQSFLWETVKYPSEFWNSDLS